MAAADVEPPELARLLDLAERPRAHEWSLRAALTRYGQPQPVRASAVIELVRRTEFAVRPHLKRLEREGEDVWRALTDGSGGDDAVDPFVVGLLRAMAELDRLGEVLATWAVDRAGERPDSTVDEAVADVSGRLEQLGVEREERPPGPAGRGRRPRGRG